MKRWISLLLAAVLVCALALTLRVSLEQRKLAAGLIRLHVVAASDSAPDQAEKCRVRDALLPVIARLTGDCADAEAARAALEAGLPALRDAARTVLPPAAELTLRLTEERFPRRDYETFSLPAGPYQTLRVTLGPGEGHNWWCVAFPALCLPATAEGFAEAAEAAGIDGELLTLTQPSEPHVEWKFRLLEWLEELFG